jgi:hypothetical protein
METFFGFVEGWHSGLGSFFEPFEMRWCNARHVVRSTSCFFFLVLEKLVVQGFLVSSWWSMINVMFFMAL